MELARWPLLHLGRPGLALVDELAHWQLFARRLRCEIQLQDASTELWRLLDLVGLAAVIGGRAPLRQVGGEAEGGEELRVDEGVEPDDLVP